MCVERCIDMCVFMCIGMGVDLPLQLSVIAGESNIHVNVHSHAPDMCISAHRGMCIAMCIGMCAEMRIGMGTGICTSTRRDRRICMGIDRHPSYEE